MATIVFVGTLGKDPQLQTSKDGSRVYARLSVAWSERMRNREGQWEQGPAVWMHVTCFGRQAENVAASLHKGDRVVVSGRVRPERWHGQQGDSTAVVVTADHVAPELTFAEAGVSRNGRGGKPQNDTATWGGERGGFGAHGEDEEPPF